MPSTTTTIFSKTFTCGDTAKAISNSSIPFYSANFHIEDQDVYYGNGTTMKAVAVADAMPEIKEVSHYVTTLAGGQGAVREVTDLILKYSQNRE